MIPFVDLDQVKSRLNIVGDRFDTDLVLMIEEATDMVRDYLKLPITEETSPEEYSAVLEQWDLNGVPPRVQAVTKQIVAAMFLHRESDNGDMLTAKIEKILIRLRDPALA